MTHAVGLRRAAPVRAGPDWSKEGGRGKGKRRSEPVQTGQRREAPVPPPFPPPEGSRALVRRRAPCRRANRQPIARLRRLTMEVEVKAYNGGGGDQEREVAMEREVGARVAIEVEVGARGRNGARC